MRVLGHGLAFDARWEVGLRLFACAPKLCNAMNTAAGDARSIFASLSPNRPNSWLGPSVLEAGIPVLFSFAVDLPANLVFASASPR
jgi:hypothetical protein